MTPPTIPENALVLYCAFRRLEGVPVREGAQRPADVVCEAKEAGQGLRRVLQRWCPGRSEALRAGCRSRGLSSLCRLCGCRFGAGWILEPFRSGGG